MMSEAPPFSSKGWTLDAWIAHSYELRALDERLREATGDMEIQRERHAREIAEMERRYNNSHFEQLNENAKRTIEERGHFVTKEEFDPFRTQVLEYMNSRQGVRVGSEKVTAGFIAFAGVVFGLVGVTLAIVMAVTGA